MWFLVFSLVKVADAQWGQCVQITHSCCLYGFSQFISSLYHLPFQAFRYFREHCAAALGTWPFHLPYNHPICFLLIEKLFNLCHSSCFDPCSLASGQKSISCVPRKNYLSDKQHLHLWTIHWPAHCWITWKRRPERKLISVLKNLHVLPWTCCGGTVRPPAAPDVQLVQLVTLVLTALLPLPRTTTNRAEGKGGRGFTAIWQQREQQQSWVFTALCSIQTCRTVQIFIL